MSGNAWKLLQEKISDNEFTEAIQYKCFKHKSCMHKNKLGIYIWNLRFQQGFKEAVQGSCKPLALISF